ncbi:MAG: ribosome-associated translation inhibitor RaiA [Gammaproteobacteria bacterium]|jgi:putative sigma-54 modulation protein|nr:ribosome-associated translation inhibitor RaiA [Gammaproteobacteria bacterium]MCH1549540.1 ribosome-associated translation inhibitor RaiA [Pseudomonadales bacterium]
MHLTLTGHHVDITESLRHYIDQKFDKLDRHSDQITQIHVVLTVEKLHHLAEAVVHVTGSELFANSDAQDMYAAIDLLIDKLDRQLLKHKEKTVERNNGSHERSPHHPLP